MDRVMAVPGDLSRPLLGLDDTSFKASEETHHNVLIVGTFLAFKMHRTPKYTDLSA